jgi:hypothetical protein
MAVVLSVARPALAEPAPLAGTPPSASRFAPMLSGDAPTIGAAKEAYARNMCKHPNASLIS